MKLSERLRQSAGTTTDPGEAESNAFGTSTGAAAPVTAQHDPLAKLADRAQDILLARIGPSLFDASMTTEQLEGLVIRELGHVLSDEKIPLTDSERDRLVDAITDQVLGYGPIERYLDDPSVTEIMVNALNGIYIERNGKLELTESTFLSNEHVQRVIERIVAPLGRRVDESSPMVDARLPDGSRVNAVIPPLALDGPVLTVRKFPKRSLTVADLVRSGSLTGDVAEYLAVCVAGRANVLISGGTGTGKTTLLNVLSGMIPETERIVTIEDAAELRLEQRHVVRLESRPPNVEGRGEVLARDLLRNALRMRPDRIVIGEVRGAEALDMLQAMNTGHEGSLSTLHANSPRDALSRLETMVLMGGVDLPVRAIREQEAAAIDLLVHLSRMPDGSRLVTRVTATDGMEGDVVTLTDLFVFDRSEETGPQGALRPTGMRGRIHHKLSARGAELPNGTVPADL